MFFTAPYRPYGTKMSQQKWTIHHWLSQLPQHTVALKCPPQLNPPQSLCEFCSCNYKSFIHSVLVLQVLLVAVAEAYQNAEEFTTQFTIQGIYFQIDVLLQNYLRVKKFVRWIINILGKDAKICWDETFSKRLSTLRNSNSETI